MFKAESITISNHTAEAIDIVTTQDDTVDESHRVTRLKIDPKDTFVIFTDRVSTIVWEKPKQG